MLNEETPKESPLKKYFKNLWLALFFYRRRGAHIWPFISLEAEFMREHPFPFIGTILMSIWALIVCLLVSLCALVVSEQLLLHPLYVIPCVALGIPLYALYKIREKVISNV